MGIIPAELAKLSVEEKLDLISELWDSISASEDALPLSEAQSIELDRRRAEGLRDPSTMIDWSVVRSNLHKTS